MPARKPNSYTFSFALAAISALFFPINGYAVSTDYCNLSPSQQEARRQIILSESETSPTANKVLSNDTVSLCQKLNLMPLIIKVDQLRRGQGNTVDLMLARQDLFLAVANLHFDIRAAVNIIGEDIALANDRYAILAERRDRAIRLNTYANFISGGITGIVGGALTLGKVNFIAPVTLDTVEGGIQTTLASWAYSQERGQRKLEGPMPNILAKLLDNSQEAAQTFPNSVWIYLNTAPSNSLTGNTRHADLLERWSERGFGSRLHKSKNSLDQRMCKAAGMHQKRHRDTVQLFEDRIAMLEDLSSTIIKMESNLQELIQFLIGTRSLPTSR